MPNPSIAKKIALAYYKNKLKFIHAFSQERAATEAIQLFSTPYKVKKKPEPEIWQKAQRLELLDADGLKIVGFSWPALGQYLGKCLIVHGFAGNSRAFYTYIEPLQLAGYQVFAFDAPAHGLSGGKFLNAKIYKETLSQIIGEFGAFDAYLAHSLGGLSLMLSLENLPIGPETKLVLVAPATESQTAVNQFYQMLKLPRKLRHAFEKQIVQQVGVPLSWYSVSRVITQVKAKILWVHDEEDAITPIKDVQPLLAQNLPYVQFYFTKGLGHSRIYSDAQVRKTILSFITNKKLEQ